MTQTTAVILPVDVLDDCYLAAERVGDIATVTGLYVLAWLYAANHHTDGFVPADWLAESCIPKPFRFAKAMVAAKLWEDAPDGWRIKAFTLCNPTLSEQGAIDRKREQKRLQKQRERGRQGDKIPGMYIDQDLSDQRSEDPAPQNVALSPVDVFRIYKRHRGPLPDFSAITPDRKRQAKKLAKDLTRYALEHAEDPAAVLERVIKTIGTNPWMAGKNDSGWKADIDYVLKDGTWARALEGRYDRRTAARKSAEQMRQEIRDANVAHVADNDLCIVTDDEVH